MGKSLNGFKFGTFTGHFLSDGVASMAVKGLINTDVILPFPGLVFCEQDLCRANKKTFVSKTTSTMCTARLSVNRSTILHSRVQLENH